MTTCEIHWNAMSVARWDDLFAGVRRSTLLQHMPYAQAVRQTQQIGARHGLIHIDGEPAGLVQLGEVGVLRNAIHALNLDRGPLWFDGYQSLETGIAFFEEFARQFPRRFGRKMRIMPELSRDPVGRRKLQDCGYVRKDGVQDYETIWVDLTPDEDTLRARLNGKWRNVLSKAERVGLTVTHDRDLETLDEFLIAHDADKAAKGYDGASPKFLRTLIGFMGPRDEAVILNAEHKGETIASILVLVHGCAATYLVGWTTDAGRRTGAHHKLLWEAMVRLKARGVKDFDLGGVNDDGAAGVKKFKLGLGGEPTHLIGMYS